MVLKYWWLCVCALVVSGWCRAQSNTVLMHVGGKPVDVAEYRYFCSMHVEESASLEQFINFKLKALAAPWLLKRINWIRCLIFACF